VRKTETMAEFACVLSRQSQLTIKTLSIIRSEFQNRIAPASLLARADEVIE
jgi:hypothetical protein